MLQANNNKSHQAGKWGPPAGKVEKDESLTDAMRRELKEETGLIITQEELTYFEKGYVTHSGYDFVFHVFSISLQDKPQIKISNEHSNTTWTTPKESLNLDLIDDEDVFIKRWAKTNFPAYNI